MRSLKVGAAAAALLATVVVGPMNARGTSFNPLTPDEPAVAPMAPGAVVFLFHSGTEETRRSIRAGDVLAVLRQRAGAGAETVGALRVDTAVGGLCFRGRVLEGEVRPHDVAVAGPVSLLVLASDAPCTTRPAEP